MLRAASFARYLPNDGIRLDVLTTRNASAVGTDYSLLNQIPSEVAIHRTVTLDLPFGVRKWIRKLIGGGKSLEGESHAAHQGSKPNLLRRAMQEMLMPDPQVTWIPLAARAARRIVMSRNIDLVLMTVPPYSCLLLVEKLRQEFPHLPIVVDVRDEWLTTTIDLVGLGRSERSLRVARRIEADAITYATAIVAVTEAARREMRARYPQQSDGKFHLIPNGFDATRLSHSIPSPESRPDGKIVITYIGTIYAATEPTTLVQALLSLPPEIKSRFSLRFIGHIEEARFRESLLQLGNMVELRGFLPQQEALATMDQTDYVLLISHDPLNVGGKFYDYVGGGKPILATVHPKGETRRLIDELRTGWCADSRDVEGIRRLFIDAANRSNRLASEFQPDIANIAQYEREHLAHRYADLLHSIAQCNRN